MPGFSYGGHGDGTNWSSERGTGPEPGGNSGRNGGGESRDRSTVSAAQKQLNDIRGDKAVRSKLSNMMMAARKLNPAVHISILRITPEGTMVISMEGLNADQARRAGLSGLVMGLSVPGYTGAVGDIETGYKYTLKKPEKVYSANIGTPLDKVIAGNPIENKPKIYRDWSSSDEKTYHYGGKKAPMWLLNRLTMTNIKDADIYTLYFREQNPKARYKIEVKNGDLNKMKATSLAEAIPIYTAEHAKNIIRNFASVKKAADKELLEKASAIIISVGDKAGAFLGDKYKTLSQEIAGNIRNFQGKRIRSYEQAMASMNKLMANPNMKIKAADKAAIINAWKSFNADDMGNKLAALGKAFKLADYGLKAKNVADKSIEGYNTGNWGPLMREVESWVASGLTSAVALAVFSATLGAMLVAAGVSATVVGIIGIIIAGLVGSLIDDKFINKLNNEIVRPAY